MIRILTEEEVEQLEKDKVLVLDSLTDPDHYYDYYVLAKRTGLKVDRVINICDLLWKAGKLDIWIASKWKQEKDEEHTV